MTVVFDVVARVVNIVVVVVVVLGLNRFERIWYLSFNICALFIFFLRLHFFNNFKTGAARASPLLCPPLRQPICVSSPGVFGSHRSHEPNAATLSGLAQRSRTVRTPEEEV